MKKKSVKKVTKTISKKVTKKRPVAKSKALPKKAVAKKRVLPKKVAAKNKVTLEKVKEVPKFEETKNEKTVSKPAKVTFSINKKIILIIGIVIIVLAAGTGAFFLIKELIVEEEVCQLYKIMPLGDSITLGSGTENLNGYREDLFEMLNSSNYHIDFVGSYNHGVGNWDKDHEGISGQIISWYRTRLNGPDDFILQRNNPDIILFHMGINNLAKGGDIDQYISDFDDNIKVIYNFNENATIVIAKIIKTGNDYYNPRVEQFNGELEDLGNSWKVQGKNVIIVDMENLLTYPEDYFDQIHPNEEGYKKLANAWYTAITPYMKACGIEEEE